MLFPETVEAPSIVLKGYKNKLQHQTAEIPCSVLHELAAYCVLSTIYCFTNFVVVKLMAQGHQLCVMGQAQP